tara:strand:- start:490 stop:900 length:411 start_codon:yes stop_codon:yes gene_type:complete
MSFQYATELSDNHVWTWISMAFEGGSNYWIDHAEIPQAVCDRYKRSRKLCEELSDCQEQGVYNWTHQIPFLEGGEVTIVSYDGVKYSLNREGIETGIMLMATNSPRHFNDLVDEGGDSITADVLLQYSLFGTVIYG